MHYLDAVALQRNVASGQRTDDAGSQITRDAVELVGRQSGSQLRRVMVRDSLFVLIDPSSELLAGVDRLGLQLDVFVLVVVQVDVALVAQRRLRFSALLLVDARHFAVFFRRLSFTRLLELRSGFVGHELLFVDQ